MKINPEDTRKYLITLRAKTGISWADLSAVTGLPDSTIRKIFNGETSDPRFETVCLIVSAMGGSLDELIGKEISDVANSDIREIYEKQLADINDRFEKYIETAKREKLLLFLLSCSLVAFLLLFIAFDFAFGNVGWIRY